MAWALATKRGGGYAVLQTPYQPVVGDTIRWGGKATINAVTYQFFLNPYTSGNDWINLSSQGKLNARVNGVNKTGSKVVISDTYFEFKLEVTTTEYVFYIDNEEQFRFSNSVPIDPIVSLNIASGGLGVDTEIEFFEVVGKVFLDPNASDHSAGSQPILVDTIGTNNATGVNFPTDGSAWLDLGGNAESYSGATSYNISTIVINSGAKSLETAAQISAVTTSLAKGNKHAQATADLATTSNLVSTGSKHSFSVAQNNNISVVNPKGSKRSFGVSNINVITSFTISGTAAELTIKNGSVSISTASNINNHGYKLSLSNVAINTITNANVAGYKYALASASFNITTNELTTSTKQLTGISSISASTIVMALGIGGSFVPIYRSITIASKLNNAVISGNVSPSITIQGVFK